MHKKKHKSIKIIYVFHNLLHNNQSLYNHMYTYRHRQHILRRSHMGKNNKDWLGKQCVVWK